MTAPARGRDAGGLVLAASYVALGIPAILVLSLVTVILLVGDAVASAGLAGAAAKLPEVVAGGTLPTWVLACTLAVQLPLMVAMVPAAHFVGDVAWYRPRGLGPSRPEGWRGVFGGWPAPAGFFALAGALGLVVGELPSWVAAQLQEVLPRLGGGTIEQIDAALRSGPLGWRLLFIAAVALGAPVVEELVFRGFLWDALRRWLPVPATWVATSLVFAAYHMDPVHATALIPTALALGWVRWMSGSVWPGVLLHAVNNALGVGAAVWLGDEAGQLSSLPVALVTAACSLGLAAGAARLRRSRGSVLASDAPLGGA